MSVGKGNVREVRVQNALGIRLIDQETGHPVPVPERMTNQFYFPPEMDEDGVDLPYGRFGITPGYYTLNEVVQLLRDHADIQAAVMYIADMLEE